jgi:hypothetical protein
MTDYSGVIQNAVYRSDKQLPRVELFPKSIVAEEQESSGYVASETKTATIESQINTSPASEPEKYFFKL